jgi:hypothetical protein
VGGRVILAVHSVVFSKAEVGALLLVNAAFVLACLQVYG